MPRNGGDRRGSSADRRARKLWLLRNRLFGGNGEAVPCSHCGQPLTYETVEADRIVPGGSYRRSNIQPSCRRCNAQRSNRLSWQPQVLA